MVIYVSMIGQAFLTTGWRNLHEEQPRSEDCQQNFIFEYRNEYVMGDICSRNGVYGHCIHKLQVKSMQKRQYEMNKRRYDKQIKIGTAEVRSMFRHSMQPYTTL